jgi:hypothetical protein
VPPKSHDVITDAQAARRYLSEFATFAAAHDPKRTARHIHDMPYTIDLVDALAGWLVQFGAALHERGRL